MKFRFSILMVIALLAVSWVPVCEGEKWWEEWGFPYGWSRQTSSYGWWNGTDYHAIVNATFNYVNCENVTDFNLTFNYQTYIYGDTEYVYPDHNSANLTPGKMQFVGLQGSGNLTYSVKVFIPEAVNKTYYSTVYHRPSNDDHSWMRDNLHVNVPLRSDIRIEKIDLSPSKPVEGEKVAVTANINNLGNGWEDIRIELYVDGKPESLLFDSIADNYSKAYTLFWTAQTGYREIEIKVRSANNATLTAEKSEKVLVRYLSPMVWSNIYIGLGTVLLLTYVRFHFRRASKRL